MTEGVLGVRGKGVLGVRGRVGGSNLGRLYGSARDGIRSETGEDVQLLASHVVPVDRGWMMMMMMKVCQRGCVCVKGGIGCVD